MFNVQTLANAMACSYEKHLTMGIKRGCVLPSKKKVIRVLNEISKLFFPAFFALEEARGRTKDFISRRLKMVHGELKKQISLAYRFGGKYHAAELACRATETFIEQLPTLREQLFFDLTAAFNGDPAAKSHEEIVFCYPGFYAILVYRVAHLLYVAGVPILPRIMSEYAHEKTGIDIHPGAEIGESFFIDHGTGVVIGETAVIGNRVKIYQNVTLGALSPRKGQSLSGKKRHPTLQDDVTVYSGASILGGQTVIGKGAVVGGNCFLTKSVGAGMRVSAKPPELIFMSAEEKENKL